MALFMSWCVCSGLWYADLFRCRRQLTKQRRNHLCLRVLVCSSHVSALSAMLVDNRQVNQGVTLFIFFLSGRDLEQLVGWEVRIVQSTRISFLFNKGHSELTEGNESCNGVGFNSKNI